VNVAITVNKLSPAGAVLALCAAALCQGSLTTPPGGLTKEGPHEAYAFGWFANARYQQVDGMHTGNGQQTMVEIAFRLDSRAHTAETAMGRTWTRVSLDISETGSYETMGSVWSNNVTTTPNRVFDQKWTWPSITGKPLLEPDVWGGATGQLRFPFTTPWVYTGKNEILMDYRFRGGTLANSSTWDFLRTAYYYLDSEVVALYQSEGGIESLPEAPTPCADSGFTYPGYNAATYGYSYAYGANNNEATLRNTVLVNHYSYYTAPNQPVLQAIGVGGSSNGVAIGARCNPLYVDLGKPAALLNMMATGNNGYSGLVTWSMPWQQGFNSVRIYIQSAWADSKTRALSLSTAVRLTLPDGAPPTFLPRYKSLFSADPDSAKASVSPATTGYYFPYTLYRTK